MVLLILIIYFIKSSKTISEFKEQISTNIKKASERTSISPHTVTVYDIKVADGRVERLFRVDLYNTVWEVLNYDDTLYFLSPGEIGCESGLFTYRLLNPDLISQDNHFKPDKICLNVSYSALINYYIRNGTKKVFDLDKTMRHDNHKFTLVDFCNQLFAGLYGGAKIKIQVNREKRQVYQLETEENVPFVLTPQVLDFDTKLKNYKFILNHLTMSKITNN